VILKPLDRIVRRIGHEINGTRLHDNLARVAAVDPVVVHGLGLVVVAYRRWQGRGFYV